MNLPATGEQWGIIFNMIAGCLAMLEYIITTNHIKIINDKISNYINNFIESYRRTIIPIFVLICILGIIIYLIQTNTLKNVLIRDIIYIVIILFISSIAMYLILDLTMHIVKFIVKQLTRTPKGLIGFIGIILFLVGNYLLYEAATPLIGV